MYAIGFQLDDVLDLAIQMETNGAEFYELAARSASNTATRLLLNGLAAMEREHGAAFIAMKERLAGGAGHADPEADAAVSSFLAAWLKGDVFDRDTRAASAVARSGTFAAILGVAVQMEKDSVTFYSGLRQYIADDEAEKVLDRIIREELRHVADLDSARRDNLA